MMEEGSPFVLNNVLYNADAHVAAWINDQFGIDLTTVGFKAMGIIDPDTESSSIRDRIIAGCYFYNHVDVPGKRDIWVTAAMKAPAAHHRAAIKQILEYPFKQLNLPRISAECDLSDDRVLKQLQILGFVQEGEKKFMGANGGSWGYFALYPSNCPFYQD